MKLSLLEIVEDYDAFILYLKGEEHKRRQAFEENLPNLQAYIHMNGIEEIPLKRKRTITERQKKAPKQSLRAAQG